MRQIRTKLAHPIEVLHRTCVIFHPESTKAHYSYKAYVIFADLVLFGKVIEGRAKIAKVEIQSPQGKISLEKQSFPIWKGT